MTGSDDKQLVNTLVTVVNTLSIPLLLRDRTLPVTSAEKNRVFFYRRLKMQERRRKA